MSEQVKTAISSNVFTENNSHCYPEFLKTVKDKFTQSADTTMFTTDGSMLFQETLKSELHGIRATIEAY